MTRSQQFAIYKPIESFPINFFVVTMIKCTSQHLRIDGDVILLKMGEFFFFFLFFCGALLQKTTRLLWGCSPASNLAMTLQRLAPWILLENSPRWGGPWGVMVKALDCGIVVNEFEFQSHYYTHLWTNTLGKGMKPIIPTSYGLNSSTTVLQKGWIWH